MFVFYNYIKWGENDMFHIAIIEDTQSDLDRLLLHLQKYQEENHIFFQTTVFTDAESFLDKYRPIYDIVFMDIELPGKNGMTAAKKLRTLDTDVPLVFITNIAHFAVNGYEVNAMDYMVKPVSYSSFQLKLKKVLAYIEKNKDVSLVITDKDGIHRVPISKIMYIEVISHMLVYHTEDGDIETRGVLKDVEQNLSSRHFLRCNNCYLVNLRHITAVQDQDVILGSITLPISRPKKKTFLDEFTKYLGV